MQLPIRKCQFCGCTRFVVGYQSQEARITIRRDGLLGNCVEHIICKSCGAILYSRIAEPARFHEVQTA